MATLEKIRPSEFIRKKLKSWLGFMSWMLTDRQVKLSRMPLMKADGCGEMVNLGLKGKFAESSSMKEYIGKGCCITEILW